MSVIYRSLQQLRQQENDRAATAQTPQAVAPRMSNLIVKAGLFVLLVVVLVGTGVYLIQREVEEIRVPESRTVAVTPTKAKPVTEATEAEAAAQEPAQEQEVLKIATAPILKQRLNITVPEAESARPSVMELSRPTKALETHFAKQARKNEDIIAIERKLIQTAKKGDFSQSKELLDSMKSRIGKKQSAAKLKWDGYLALRERRYEDAENFYRQALSLRPMDLTSNLNLVYSLIGQKKMKDSRRVYRQLIDRYPMNQRVQSLGKLLGEF